MVLLKVAKPSENEPRLSLQLKTKLGATLFFIL